MSLRASARTEVRRNRYNLHKVYKFKKGEKLLKNLLKKRHEQSSAKLENLSSMVAGVYSNDNNMQQLEATTQLCELLAIEPKPIDEVVQSGVVPRLVEFLTRDDFPQLQFVAAGAFTKVASGTSHKTKVVIDHGVVSIFVKLLASPSDDVRQQAVWALGNIAAHSDRCCDLVLGQGAMIPLLFQLNEGANLSMLRKATWTLSQFCKGQPQFEQMKPALPALECLLLHSKDEEVLTNACWSLSYLSNGRKEIKAVIDSGICKCLVELLNHNPSPSVLMPALLTIRYIIMEGNHIQLQAVIETGLIAPLVKLLQTAEDDRIIKEAVWAMAYAASRATNKQIKYLVNQGCINPLCDLLECSNSRILIFCLKVLEKILKAGEAEKDSAGGLNIYKDLIQDAEGLERIKYLQGVDSELTVEWAVKILHTYWLEDFQKCVKVKPGQIRCT